MFSLVEAWYPNFIFAGLQDYDILKSCSQTMYLSQFKPGRPGSARGNRFFAWTAAAGNDNRKLPATNWIVGWNGGHGVVLCNSELENVD